jgi:hypothetical protein|eukprot:scaffold6641_cov270-Chaetoceros_neogracile.AAC.11
MKTNWGCTHRPGGDAYIEGTRDFCRKASSSVRIYDLRCEELKPDGWREPPFFGKRVLQKLEVKCTGKFKFDHQGQCGMDLFVIIYTLDGSDKVRY